MALRSYKDDFLERGTVEDHLGTIRRAIANGTTSIWTGEIARNQYLQETLRFAEVNGLVVVTERVDQDGQASYFDLEWSLPDSAATDADGKQEAAAHSDRQPKFGL